MTEQQANRLIALASLQVGISIGIFVALLVIIVSIGSKR